MLKHVEVGPHLADREVVAADVFSNVLHAVLERRLAICLVLGDKRSVVVAEPADGFRREPRAKVLSVVLDPSGLVVAPEGGIAIHEISEFAPKEEVVCCGLDELSGELLDKRHVGGSPRRRRFSRARRPPLASAEDGGRSGANSRRGDGIVGLVGIGVCLGVLVIETILLGHAVGLVWVRPFNGISSFGIVGVDEAPDLTGVEARHADGIVGGGCWATTTGLPGQGTSGGTGWRLAINADANPGRDSGRTRAELWTSRVSMTGKVLVFDDETKWSMGEEMVVV